MSAVFPRPRLLLWAALIGSLLLFASIKTTCLYSEEINENTPLAVWDQEIRKLEEVYKKTQGEAERTQLATAYRAMSARLVKENQLNEALNYLEWAEDLERESASASGAGGYEGHVTLGLAALAQGDFYAAEKRFDEAVAQGATDEARRTMAVAIHNAGVAKLNEDKMADAERYLLLSTRYDARLPSAWNLLGDLTYNTQRLTEAKTYWEKSLALEKSEAVAKKLEKLGREAGVELGLAQYGSEHFIIRYKRSDETYQGYQLKQILDNAYRVISRDFNYFPDIQIPVILYDEAEFRQVMESPHWAGGMYDGKIRLPVYEAGVMAATDFERLVYHELTHAFIFGLAGQACPVWLNEGLAQYQENKVQPVQGLLFANALRQGKIYGLEQMQNGLTDMKKEEEVGLFYDQAYQMTAFLVERYRMYRVVEVLKQLKSGSAFESALQKSTGLSRAQFEKNWLESIGFQAARKK